MRRRWEDRRGWKVPFIGNVLVPRTLVRIQLAAECECQDRGNSQRRRQLPPWVFTWTLSFCLSTHYNGLPENEK